MSDDQTVSQAPPAPGQPVTTTEQQFVPPRPLEEAEAKPFYRTGLGIAIIVVAIILVVLLLGLGGCAINGLLSQFNQSNIAGKMEPTPANPGPAKADGVKNWIQFKAAADALDTDTVSGNIMYDSLHELHPEQGDIRQAVTAMASLETSGQSFMYTAPKGAAFINTDYKVVGDSKLGYRFFEDVTTNTVTVFLTFADDTVAVKAGCANAVRFHKSVPSKKIVFRPPGKKRPPAKCGNNTGQYANHARQSPGTNVGKTPGYPSRGNAERITSTQHAIGSGNNGQAGHAGTGSGGTTASSSNSSGEANSGGGASDTSLPGGTSTAASGDVGKGN